MVASLSAASFYSSVFSSSFPSTNKPSIIIFVHTHEVKPNSSPSYGGLHVKAKSQALHNNINNNGGAIVSLSISPLERSQSKEKGQIMPPKPPKKRFDNMFIWSMFLSNGIKTTTRGFVEAERKWILPKFLNVIANTLGAGRIIHHGLAFRQNYKIRSYEIGFDLRVSLATIMNYLQDTKVNHLRSVGILVDDFCVTPEMNKKNLKWVVTGTDIVVDHYPSWRDMVQVDTWTSRAGRNGVRCDWLFRDLNTGKAIIRVTSFYVMVDKETTKISKFTNKIRKELEPHFMHNGPFYEEENKKLPYIDESSADNIRRGLSPRWIDLRKNLNVNNANYISWILEGTPASILESYELCSMKMEYQKECRHDSELKSLTAASNDNTSYLVHIGGVKFEHSLCLESGTEIARAVSIWRPKYANNFKCTVALVEEKILGSVQIENIPN